MFDAAQYAPMIAELVQEERLNPLGPGEPNKKIQPFLKALSLSEMFGDAMIIDRFMAEACLAGVWLHHNFLEESHRISQEIATTTGSYWHSLMHRRQPDSWNSKYWLDQTGKHPVFPALREAAESLAEHAQPSADAQFLLEQREWNPHRFVDLCERARTGKNDARALCERVQLAEWRLLFDFCYRQAIR
jgi:hypothetical protein